MKKMEILVILFFIFLIYFNSKNSAISETIQNKDNNTIKLSDKQFTFEADNYIQPNCNVFFSDDINGAQKLNILFDSPDKDSVNDKELLDTVRCGLKKTKHNKNSILRWLGNKYIWGKSPQNKYAIEIMYHASSSDEREIRGAAIYFGLSVTENKTENIFKALVDSCMKSKDWNDVGRAIWGCRQDKNKLLPYLEPYIKSNDDEIKQVAIAFKNEIIGTEEFRVWQARKIKNDAAIKYKEILPKLKADFIKGDFHKQKIVLEYFRKNQDILTQMDDSFLEGWVRCVNHPDVAVRRETARIVGSFWIWHAKEQSPKAIDIIYELSNDTDVDVVGNAVYNGLSTIRDKNDKIVNQLLNIAKRYYNNEKYNNGRFFNNNYKRCFLGLKNKKYECSILLEKEIEQNHTDPKIWYPAYGVYKDFIGGEPSNLTKEQKLYVENKNK